MRPVPRSRARPAWWPPDRRPGVPWPRPWDRRPRSGWTARPQEPGPRAGPHPVRRTEEDHSQQVRLGRPERGLHAEPGGGLAQPVGQRLPVHRRRQIDLGHPHVQRPGQSRVEVGDVPASVRHDSGERGHDTEPIGPVDGEDVGRTRVGPFAFRRDLADRGDQRGAGRQGGQGLVDLTGPAVPGAAQGHREVTSKTGHRGVGQVQPQSGEDPGGIGDDPGTVAADDGDGVLLHADHSARRLHAPSDGPYHRTVTDPTMVADPPPTPDAAANDPMVAAAVTGWYLANARDLPWRRPDASPWAVLVSEVMLQQTQVSRVEPVWREWLARWPTPTALAAEPAGEAVRAWGRLGYPRRALRLHACAVAIVERHAGAVPRALEDLLGLRGIDDHGRGSGGRGGAPARRPGGCCARLGGVHGTGRPRVYRADARLRPVPAATGLRLAADGCPGRGPTRPALAAVRGHRPAGTRPPPGRAPGQPRAGAGATAGCRVAGPGAAHPRPRRAADGRARAQDRRRTLRTTRMTRTGAGGRSTRPGR